MALEHPGAGRWQLNHFSAARGLRVPALTVNQGGKFSTQKNAVGVSSRRITSVCAEFVCVPASPPSLQPRKIHSEISIPALSF